MFGSGQLQFFSGGEASFYPHLIANSLRFTSGDSSFLSRTTGSATNTFTFSTWLKRGVISSSDYQYIFASGASGLAIGKSSDATLADKLYIYDGSSTQAADPFIRDVGAWYHIVLSSNSGTGVLYINGESVKTSISVASLSTSSGVTRVGRYGSGNFYFDGYLAETHLVTGSALTPSSFGETKNDIWVAKAYTGSHGDDGFKLTYADSSDIGNDSSGENHDLTPSGFQTNDVVNDSPTNNWATMSPLTADSTASFDDGNLKSHPADNKGAHATFGMESGKWYWETQRISGQTLHGIIATDVHTNDASPNASGKNAIQYYFDGRLFQNGSTVSTLSGINVGDLVVFTYDTSNRQLSIYCNGTSSSELKAQVTAADGFTFSPSNAGGSSDAIVHFNFGQDSSFGGTKTAQGNTDENGVGDFFYTPPAGFLALCANNLPAPTFDPNQNATPDQYFNTVLWTGNETARSITGVGFSPNWVWIKNADFAKWHHVFDTVRGTGKAIYPNEPNQEATGLTDHLTSFDSDGFSLGDHVNVNKTGDVNVAWNWRAGTSFSFSGETDTLDSSGSTSQDAGFSIVSYTGGSAERVKHNLGAVPEMIMVKDRDAGNSWAVYHKDLSTDFFLELSFNYAQAKGSFPRFTPSDSSISSSSLPTSTYFFVRAGRTANISGNEMIAYCFRSLDGYSKMGSYVGNNSTDNSFVYTGFKPAFLMIKNRDAIGNWGIWDTERNSSNVAFNILRADIPDDEGHTQPNNNIDILSNGFKVRGNTGISGDAVTYIYMAFAEQPFKYANAR